MKKYLKYIETRPTSPCSPKRIGDVWSHDAVATGREVRRRLWLRGLFSVMCEWGQEYKCTKCGEVIVDFHDKAR